MATLNAALFAAMFLLLSHCQGSLLAYLDPGTGSIAIQLVMGALVAGLATLKLYWARVRTYFLRRAGEHDIAGER